MSEVQPPYSVAGLDQPGRTLVMGVVNVTPDSFSDGGEWFDPEAAVQHGLDLIADGADLIDVGGESTRPGAQRPTVAEELARVLPVITELARAGATVSVDTMRAEVASQALAAGAGLVNDVSGGQADPDMLGTVAKAQVPYVCMHWRGHATQMQARAHYRDVVSEVAAALTKQIEVAVAAGVDPARLVLDPGFGFAKTGEHNWELLQRFEELTAIGQPLLVGVSRKAFLGTLLADSNNTARPARERDDATTALTTLLAERGVWCVRVHAVRASRDAVATVQRFHTP